MIATAQRTARSIVAVGHVDHGKSTLIGRLIADTGNLPDGKLVELLAASERRGVPFEWSFVLDALQRERDQAITIDTTRTWLRIGGEEIVVIDAPGHVEFVRNMVTGASDARAALLVVDAEGGVTDQTRRHAVLLELIGVAQAIVVVNKMDLVAYARVRFEEIVAEMRDALERIGVRTHACIPVVARDGDNIVSRSERMTWYAGPTVAESLVTLPDHSAAAAGALRLAVQGVLRRGTDRIVTGRIAAGQLVVGMRVAFSPGARRATVRTIERWRSSSDDATANAGESIGFTLDAPLYVDRGDIVSETALPATHRFRARVLWLDDRELVPNAQLRLQIATRSTNVVVERIERIVDVATLETRDADQASRNDVVDIIVRSREPLAIEAVSAYPDLGRFLLIDGQVVVAGGVVRERLASTDTIVPIDQAVGPEERAIRSGHRGHVVWFTGLPASGKSTLALALERRLFERGIASYVIDGDTLRAGLCADLDFSPAGRAENVRRAAEVAALVADAGLIAIVAMIAPSAAGRAHARELATMGYTEVFVSAPLAVREARDPKGHYARARDGDLPDYSGISGEYEVPREPELVIDTSAVALEEAIALLEARLLPRIRPTGDHIDFTI